MVVICSTFGIFKPIYSTVVVVCSAVGVSSITEVFSPVHLLSLPRPPTLPSSSVLPQLHGPGPPFCCLVHFQSTALLDLLYIGTTGSWWGGHVTNLVLVKPLCFSCLPVIAPVCIYLLLPSVDYSCFWIICFFLLLNVFFLHLDSHSVSCLLTLYTESVTIFHLTHLQPY